MESSSKTLLVGAAMAAVGAGVLFATRPRKARASEGKVMTMTELWPRLREEYIKEFTTEGFDTKACERVRWMLDYNCLGGKLYRGGLIVDTVETLCKHRGMDFASKAEQACVLGWCVEILQAYFLVADDIMDASTVRRGQPCWYKLPSVQMDAVNDSFIIESMIYFLIKKYFKATPAVYLPVVELFQRVSLTTQMGQMLDTCSQPQGHRRQEANLDNFSMPLYKQIVKYKTALYTFYLPLACGMLLCGLAEDSEELRVTREIAVELGEKFQIQDDYLDCYQSPEILGKLGTDIQDHKCCWLVAQALQRVSKAQRAVLDAHYGKEDQHSVDAIKQLYRELDLTAVYETQETESKERIEKLVELHSARLPPALFTKILQKIHKRQK